MNAIITGATKGIGKAISFALAKEGYNLAVNSRSASDLNDLKETLEAKYPNIKVFAMQTDVSKRDQVYAFAEQVITQLRTIDVLVNNAGVFLPGQMLEEADGALENMIDTNLYSAYNLTRKIVPTMKENGGGAIFNICSIASFMAYPNASSYSISKFAMLGMSKVLRAELLNEAIKVTSIMPGATWSNSWAGAEDEFPRSRLVEPEDIAEAVISALRMGPSAVVEEIVIRPQLGDL